jgi:O-antigen/teichoic acid export membrane protein
VGLALLARPFTLVFLTEKWAEAIPVIQAIALYAMFLSLMHNANSAYKAEGNFSAITWIGLIRLLFLFPALWWAAAVAGSMVVVGWAHALVACISLVISLIVAVRMLKISLSDLMNSLRPSFLAGTIMAVVIFAALNLVGTMSPVEQLLLAIPVGALTYGIVLWFVARHVVLEIFQKMQTAVTRRTKVA